MANNRIVLENQGKIDQSIPRWLITIYNLGFCVDLEYGDATAASKAQVQTWTCSNSNDNTNQVWNL